MIYLFDVDGTLTPSRGLMDPDFKQFFKTLPNFSLVTGSDVDKTIEQVGQDIFEQADYCFNCSGNEVYMQGVVVARNNWTPSDKLLAYLDQCMVDSPYRYRYGNHIEHRQGTINFSVVGRNAIGDQRSKYSKWDQQYGERHRLTVKISSKFIGISASIGGETGIDIYPIGCDKSQVLKYLHGHPIHFFGDQCGPMGNDYAIYKRLKNRSTCRVSHVKNWRETWKILQEK
jgi:phosphomannomutase